MAESYRVPRAEVRVEIDKIKGSRFIATLTPVESVEAAEARLAQVRAEFHDARHVASAWRLGLAGEVTKAHDDGEPGGSAGKPILAQIEGSGLTQVVVLVTRYFGGTKLGVGGLVRAYGGAAAAALERVEVEERRITRAYHVRHPYECSGVVESILSSHGASARDPRYGEAVEFVLDLTASEAPPLLRELVDRTAGRLEIAGEPT